MKQQDERDTIFSRIFELKEGSDNYNDYYRLNPELLPVDEKLREQRVGVYDNDVLSQRLVESTFKFLEDIRPLAHQTDKSKDTVNVNPNEFTPLVKKLASSYGAVLTGVAEMPQDLYYSHRGRGNKYGEPVDEKNPYAIVYAVEMDKTELLNAPGAKESVEVVRGYSRVALIGMIISYYIRNLGYDANCHMDGETTLPMVPVAHMAGLGEIGRIGLLVNKKYGSKLRLGVVTTNIPLNTDSPISFGLKKVCKTCRKCSGVCPSKAIDDTPEHPWEPTSDSKCFESWKKFGTDCGLCIVSCPFTR